MTNNGAMEAIVNRGDRLPVIAIGGSAGALNALYALLDAMPADLGAAIVVILHLDPHHPSNLAELLARHTSMPVRSAEDGMAVEVNSIYVVPPGAVLQISGGILRLSERKDHAPQMLVDVFLRALAEHSRERAACIILSGTGTDGTLGLRAIKEKGGLAIVQDPSEASHNGMPCSAIASTSADLILPVREMPEAIRTYVQHTYAKYRPGVGADDITVRDRLDQIVAVLARMTPHDFRGYKEGTLIRRIERRMALRRTLSVEGYLELLEAEEGEANQLAKDLLINVTTFFRDPQAFNYLAETALPEMLTRRGDNDEPVRVWVPGCSTGEEAYSLAILLTEVLGKLRSSRRFQVFASDVDEDALSFAREGIYPESIAADVSPERLRRFFVHENHAYCVAPDVRETVAFATHNVLMDSPFSRLDLISCRNVLIYLKTDVQERLLQLFHFALIPDGLLCLGTSETAATQRELFQPLSRTERVYRRVGSSHPPGVRMPMPRGEDGRTRWSDAISGLQAARQRDRLQERARGLALDAFAPASVVVNPRYEALYFFGPTDRYLQVPSGEASRSVLDLAREGLRSKLRVALQKAFVEKQLVSIRGATIKRNGEAIRVVIRAQPFGWDSETLALISLTDEPPTDRDHPVDHAKEWNGVGSVRDLERELEETRTELQETIHELEMTNAALQTANDEATSMNEELLTANEELETSKEELQSVNEEMITLNSQLQQQAEKYRKTGDDLHNLLVSSEVATIFLDKEWRIKRFTPALRRLVNIIETDIGRPFSDLSPLFDDPELLEEARQVLTYHAPKVRQVRSEKGEVYTRRILPYCTKDNRTDGVVITFVDITELKQAEDALADSKARAVQELQELETLYLTAPIGLALLDADLRFLRINEMLAEINGVPVEAHLGRRVGDVLPELAPIVEPLLRRVLATGEPIHDIEIEGETPQQPGIVRTWREQLYPLKASDGSVLAVGAIVREITEQKRFEAALRDSEARFRTVVDTAADGIITIDQHGIIEFVNTQAERMFGYRRGELIGKNVDALTPETVQPEHDAHFARFLRTGQPKIVGARRELVGRRQDGSTFPISLSIGEFQINEDRFFTCIARDITLRKEAETALRDRTQRYELVATGARDAIWDWDVLNHRVFFSSRWKELRGFAPDEVSDREEEWSANIHPEDAPRVMAAVQAHFEGKSAVFAEEYRIRCKDGSWKWVLDRGVALRDADGRVVRMAGSETDITERKRSEEALRLSEERLRRFVDAAPVAIMMFDRDMRYLAVSQRFLADYRLDDQELVGRSHYDVFPEIPQHWREIHQRCLQGAVERSAGEPVLRADGSVDWVRWEVQPW